MIKVWKKQRYQVCQVLSRVGAKEHCTWIGEAGILACVAHHALCGSPGGVATSLLRSPLASCSWHQAPACNTGQHMHFRHYTGITCSGVLQQYSNSGQHVCGHMSVSTEGDATCVAWAVNQNRHWAMCGLHVYEHSWPRQFPRLYGLRQQLI
jgi:hypothetical protein